MVTNKMELTNWGLEANASLIERLNGVNSEEGVSEVVHSLFEDTLPLAAMAIFIRPYESDYFEFRRGVGLNENHDIKPFKDGEGFLGKVTQRKKITLIDPKQLPNIKYSTATIETIPTVTYLCPLVHNDSCVGLIELTLKNDGSPAEKYMDFLQRASRNIALNIRIGQDYQLVTNLLTESQQQAEELEAQQEELRITNEELVHKTHLLEASEEELRVQQEELSHTNFELNQKAVELAKKNADLNDAQNVVEEKIKEIEQASKYKSEFMANMSHELRTPLNSILILAKLLNDNKHGNLTSEQVKFANVIYSAGTDLLALINELLDLAKIEAGKVDLNEDNIELTSFVREIEELFTELAKDKGIEFNIHIAPDNPHKIVSDEYRLQQVLKNFLSNAFKFTESGGKVELSIREQKGELYFEVRDTGKGISKEKQALIFEAFLQEDGSTSRKYGGTGLGLSISREIAFLLSGRIQLKSEPGQGSTFTLIIPIRKVQAQDKELSAPPGAKGNN